MVMSNVKHSLGHGWEAELLDNGTLRVTHDATGETLVIPPESTETLINICEDIVKKKEG